MVAGHAVRLVAGTGAKAGADHRCTMGVMSRRTVELLTREGCGVCRAVYARLTELSADLGFELRATDVDAAAAAGDSALRAEFGDRLPVILLDGREHSYWDLDEARLREDLARDIW